MSRDLVIFTITLPITIYLLNCLAVRKCKKLELQPLLLYVSVLAAMGVFGEIFVGSIYNALFHQHLWDYSVYPIHSGFTSLYAPFIWGAYGFHLYLFQDTLKQFGITKKRHLALWFALETIVLEALANGSYKLLSGEFLFYYTPSDLWHLTSLRAMPFYIVAGIAITRIISRSISHARYSIIMNFYFMGVLVYLAQ